VNSGPILSSYKPSLLNFLNFIIKFRQFNLEWKSKAGK